MMIRQTNSFRPSVFYKIPRSNNRTTSRAHWFPVSVLCVLLVLLSACGGDTTDTKNPGSTPTKASQKPTSTPTVANSPVVVKSHTNDWTMYHNDKAHTGYIATTPDPKSLGIAWNKKLDGAVYAEPLVVGGLVIVATENNSVYAFDSQTGTQKWRANAGPPVRLSMLPCGNIDPLGITGTPAYDPQTKLIFAVAETTGPSHILIGIDIETGNIKLRRSIDLPGMQPGTHQERGALMIIQDRIYIPIGGLYGDCGAYLGRVISAQTDGKGELNSYTVPTTREGGIWASPGPAIDENNRLYVSVGNGEQTSGEWDHSDSVLRLNPALQLEDAFAPGNWQEENAGDVDLGSMSPVLLPNGQTFIAGKSGRGYLLRTNNLGGVGGQVTDKETCASYGGAASTGPEVYLPCNDGVMQIKIGKGTITNGWKAPANITGSPVIGGHTLYTVDPGNGALYALNVDNGQQRAQVQIGEASRFATPTIMDKMVFVGTKTGIVAVNIQ